MLKIKNTLTKEKEVFKPLEEKKVKFYQCGPTVYWNQHIGNMRAVVLADFINRSFQYLGYEVDFVRNYTDVGHLSGDNEGDADTGEDRMEKAVKRDKKNPEEIADFYIKNYEQDIEKLNTLAPNSQPKATEFILEQVEMIESLLEKDFAYITPLAIYFDTKKAKDYHRLSGQNFEQNISGAGSGKISDSHKKNSSDFSLWFFKKGAHTNALQTWDSPFGVGFPGWHLECSAMAKKILGDTLDIKMGGIEHIPVHHTNEIAQSENANQKEYVRYWVHNEHLNVDNKKMSKSEGTSYLLSDIEAKGFSALDLRYFFLQAHYRSKQNFTWVALEASATARKKLEKKALALGTAGKPSEVYKKEFKEKIEEDFNTPQALAVVWKVFKDKEILDEDKKATILDFDKILGLKLG
jgi:cysteinyl-tRNA synthetase